MAKIALPPSHNDAARVDVDHDWWAANAGDADAVAAKLCPILFVVQKRLHRSDEQPAQSPGPPTISQQRAVHYLSDHECVTTGMLADALELSRPAVTELIDRLVERGSVIRASNPIDRRQVMIVLTPEARRKSAEIRKDRLGRLSHIIARLAPHERQGFVRGMKLLADEFAPDEAASSADDRTFATTSSRVETLLEDSTHE